MVRLDIHRAVIRFLSFLFFIGLALLTACRTDYSTSAVERAREFALDNLRGITPNQREFIRFTQPEIYEDRVFPRYVIPLLELGHNKVEKSSNFPTAPHQDFMHSCVVWSPPDLAGKIVVIGDGERSMRFWRPYRVVVKQFLPNDIASGAIASCQKYAQNGMLYLSNKTRNRIRFSDPEEICFTKLDIPESAEKKQMDLETEWKQYLDEQKNAEQRQITQMSVIWPADDKEHKVVFSGYTNNGSISGWKLITAEFMRKEKLDQNRLTKEEEALIKVAPLPEFKLIFPDEQEVERTSIETTPDTPQDSRTIMYK